MPYDDPIMRELGGYFKAEEPGRRERADAWATAIGLQKVDGLVPSQFLFDTAKDHIEGRITQNQARRRIRDYYAAQRRKRRYLLIDLTEDDKRKIHELTEDGRKEAAGKGRSEKGGKKSSLKSREKSGLKSGSKSGLKILYKTDAKLLTLIGTDGDLTIPRMQAELGMSRNGIKKVLARLKAAGRLRRVGPDKGGRWEVTGK